jgi:hypothetical protein
VVTLALTPSAGPDFQLYKFKAIAMNQKILEAFARTSSGRRARTLLLTHPSSPDSIFSEVLNDVTELMPLLELNGAYRCQVLCNPDSWSQWFIAERRVAGMCLAFLVRRGIIKLVRRMTRSGRWSGQYCLPESPLLGTPKQERIVGVVATGFNLPAM